MIIFDITLISLAISLLWIYYLKLIDLFENEKWQYIAITFALGSVIPFIIYPIHDFLYHPLNISNSDYPLFSFLYFTFGVGLLEEVVKALPVLIILKFFKPAINEPLDYIKYICISALGFAFGENVEYALHFGSEVLISRSILSVPAHMFFSGLFIYGFVLYKYNKATVSSVFLYGFYGFLAHGLYDFLLDFEARIFGYLLMLIFFMLLISTFTTILNNCLNNSPFYTPKKAINQELLRSRLTTYYAGIIFVIMIYCFRATSDYWASIMAFIFFKSMILYLVIIRLSRFSIIPALWKPVKLEFPFHYKAEHTADDLTVFFGMFTVKGEGYNDSQISGLYEEIIWVVPISTRKSYLEKAHKGFIEKKIYRDDETVYITKIFLDGALNSYKTYALVAKKKGATHTEEDFPIASLNRSENNRLVFIEWVILKKTT